MPIERVLTGGQDGVDKAAWDAALACGVPIGGTVPAGYWTKGEASRYEGKGIFRETNDADRRVIRDLAALWSGDDCAPNIALQRFLDRFYPQSTEPSDSLLDRLARTYRNVADADGTLIVHFGGPLTEGTRATFDFTNVRGKSLLVIELGRSSDVAALVARARTFIDDAGIRVLNVAGPCAGCDTVADRSAVAGRVRHLLTELFGSSRLDRRAR